MKEKCIKSYLLIKILSILSALFALAIGLNGCGGGGGGGGTTVVAPTITTQPNSLTVVQGSTATLAVVATGGSLAYQWHYVSAGTDTALSGGTSSSLTLSSVTTGNAGSYYVVVSNSAGTATSDSATLTVTSSSGDGTVSVN